MVHCKEFACQCRRLRFNPWVRKIPWSRKWQPTPVFLPRKFHGQRSLAAIVRRVAKSQISLINWARTHTVIWLRNRSHRTSIGMCCAVPSCFSRVWLFSTLWATALQAPDNRSQYFKAKVYIFFPLTKISLSQPPRKERKKMKWKHVTSNEDNSLTSTTPRVNWSLARNGQSHLDLGSENQKAGASYGEGGGWSLPRPAVPPKGMEILLCYRLAQGAPDFTWFFLDCSLPAGVHQVALRHNDILQAVDKEKMSAKRKKMCCGLEAISHCRCPPPIVNLRIQDGEKQDTDPG